MNNASIASVVENAESMETILFIGLFPYIVFRFLVKYQM
jgi:hypothetical protein